MPEHPVDLILARSPTNCRNNPKRHLSHHSFFPQTSEKKPFVIDQCTMLPQLLFSK